LPGVGGGGGASSESSVDGGKREISAVFNRQNRTCHVCTNTSVENCDVLKVRTGKVKKKNCKTDVQENCEDIQM